MEMTLREKFSTMILDKDIAEWEKECEQIADDYAIGFAEWRVNDWVHDERWTKISDIKELLEIYKKEKGL